jgi:thiol-disulfide isomerase/thioredoxin
MTMNSAPRRFLSRRSLLTFAAVFSFLFLSCKAGESSGSRSLIGSTPEFRLKTLDGRTLGPRDFPGKVVVIDFWATWCGPCHVQARILEPLYQDYKGKGVQFLAANVGEDEATVRSFTKKKPFPYPVLLDSDETVAMNHGIYALPTLMVVDKKGKILHFKSGLTDGPTLRRVLKAAGV